MMHGRIWMLVSLLSVFVLALIGIMRPASVQAAAVTETTVETIPFEDVVQGCGEDIIINGEIHVVFHVTEDASGGFHVHTLFHPQGLTGVGATSGATYHAVGETKTSFNTNGATTYTFVNNFKMIGEGQAPNYLVHNTVHVTINANGEPSAFVDNTSVECRG